MALVSRYIDSIAFQYRPILLILSLSKGEDRSGLAHGTEQSSYFDRLRACEKIDVWLECNPASFETPAKAGSSG